MSADPPRADPGTIQELLLDAIPDARGWSAVLGHLSHLLSARQAVLEVHPSNRRDRPPCILGAWGVEKRYCRKYLSAFASRNPWMIHGRSRFHAGAVLPGERILSKRKLVRTEFYTEFLRPQNVINLMGAVLADDENGLTTVVFLRSREAGAFRQAEISLLRRYVPALQKALRTHLRLRTSHHRRGTMQGVLDRLRIGIVSLDGRGKTVSINRRAGEILEKREALGLSSGRLKCVDPKETRSFDNSVKNVLHGGDAERAAKVLAVRRVGGGPPLYLVLFPLRTSGSRMKEILPRILVILMDPKKDECLSIPHLSHLFGLSRAEARLAALMGRGLSLAETAGRMGIRVNTARTHLKHVFSKTRTCRQGELVHLLLGSAAAWMGPGGMEASPGRP